MNDKPKALDLFCGAGGVCRGLQQAGYEVTGVDMVPQPDYPGWFVLADVLSAAPYINLPDFDLVWASPPCQPYTRADLLNKARWGDRPVSDDKLDLVEPTRALLVSARRSVIENVPGAPILEDLKLTGRHFGNMSLLRPRIFEVNGFECPPPPVRRVPLVPAMPLYRHGGLWTQTHVNWIADNNPAFYRRWFQGFVCATGGGAATYRTINNRRAAGAWTEAEGYRWLKRCTDLPELRAALDCPHIITGGRTELRPKFNNAIPAFYARWIGEAALGKRAPAGQLALEV